MSYEPLPHLEMTMTNLAAYLMVAQQKHPKYILGKPDGRVNGSRSPQRLRITQHYTAALLACGLPPTLEELENSTWWFINPIYNDSVIDIAEMTKLEALLNLKPEDPSVSRRLKRLIEQRLPDSELFFIAPNQNEQESKNHVFDTLWALKVIIMARDREVLDASFTYRKIQKALDKVFDLTQDDKDVALALRLQYELNRNLEPFQQKRLDRLLANGRKQGYMWGFNAENTPTDFRSILQAMHNRQLAPHMIGTNETLFRDLIINTCYVIENLSALRLKYRNASGDIAEVLQNSMELWWEQFHGEDAPHMLRALFSNEYRFLMVLCRTAVAVNAYLGHPLGSHALLSTLREQSRKFNPDEWPEEDVENALRFWVHIKVSKEPERLRHGRSDANILRIEPIILNPLDPNGSNLLNRSLVVKYGSKDEIEKESQNYHKLPESLRPYFVRIPNIVYENPQRQAFVIMEDLNDYRTLYESYEKLLQNTSLAHQLGEFLMEIHKTKIEGLTHATNMHLRDIYIRPMLDHIDQVLNQVNNMKSHELISDERYERFFKTYAALSDSLANIIQRQSLIDRFPLAFMHGDLHTRNIMMRFLDKGQHADFKLIDLVSLRPDGDLAHDAGYLLTDLEMLHVGPTPTLNRAMSERLQEFCRIIEERYSQFAAGRDDSFFPVRLQLARARASIRIAKGEAKRSARYLEAHELRDATLFIGDAMQLAEGASQHLENACKIIREANVK